MVEATGPPVRRAVAIGGGTGLPLVLRALLNLGYDTTAIVTMADDGGSSGLLRRELGMLPPGDVRNCLVALSDAQSLPARLFQYRFPHGEGLAGHALGNLVIAALADLTGGFPRAIEAAGRLLDAKGHVLPSTLSDVVLHAEDRLGRPVSGQANIAVSEEAVANVFLEPHAPPAYPPALAAIAQADVVVVGPGSLFTSVIPNFLVAGMAEAVRASNARRVYVCNVANQRGETCGFDAADHVRALIDHGLAGALDAVLVHQPPEPPHAQSAEGRGSSPTADGGEVEVVTSDATVRALIRSVVPEVAVADLADASLPTHHDPARLEAALAGVLSTAIGPRS
jgi:uncharacterized cofD-like protein